MNFACNTDEEPDGKSARGSVKELAEFFHNELAAVSAALYFVRKIVAKNEPETSRKVDEINNAAAVVNALLLGSGGDVTAIAKELQAHQVRFIDYMNEKDK